MNTKRITTEIAQAADAIRAGQLVAVPTETVYGLAGNGLDPAAVAQIYEIKGRPAVKPLSLMVHDASAMARYCADVPPAAYTLAEAFWPGPMTMIVPKGGCIPDEVSCGLDTVGIRLPSHPMARALIRESGVPLAAPSANTSGRPSTTTAAHVMRDMDGKIAAVLDGGACGVGVESTVITLALERPRLLRPGGITLEQLRSVLGEVDVDRALYEKIGDDVKVSAPGMKYRHYAPAEPVVIVSGSREKAAAYIRRHFTPGDRVLCFEEELPLYAGCSPLSYGREADVNTLSAGLFAALRELDDPGIHQVYARCPVGGGVAYAVQNRLKKAAAFHIVDAEEEA